MIFTIRGVQVMFDSDLDMLYGVETKRLKEQVKRNINRFPDDFMFQQRELPSPQIFQFRRQDPLGDTP